MRKVIDPSHGVARYNEEEINQVTKKLLADEAQCRVCHQSADFLFKSSSHQHIRSGDKPPFKSRRKLGRGAIGFVDEVQSVLNAQIYARKRILRLSDFFPAKDRIDRFDRELQTLRRISHWHCVELIGSYTTTSFLGIILSPLADSNLREYLETVEGSFKLELVEPIHQWFGCLATAMQYLHENKIRHRDIKPDNILVYGRRVLLVDFELAYDWTDYSHSSTTAPSGFTRRYAAPEVINYKKRNSTADVWSLGCVFLEMATVAKRTCVSQMREFFSSRADSGHTDYFFNNKEGIIQWILGLRQLSQLDNDPLAWISEMLQQNPKQRPKAAKLVQLIRNSPNQRVNSSRYFAHCCQNTNKKQITSTVICSACGTTLPKREPRRSMCTHCKSALMFTVLRNPSLDQSRMPIQQMLLSFYPSFMVSHLNEHYLSRFTKCIVANSQWQPIEVRVRLSCLPRRPLHLRLQEFTPSCDLIALQNAPSNQGVDTRSPLPVGIQRADPAILAEGLNKYINDIIDNHLTEYSPFLLRFCSDDHPSRVLHVIFNWYETWKEMFPIHEALLMKGAIKLIVLNKIIDQALLLEEIPGLFKRDSGCNGPSQFSEDHQSPLLVNLQVKVGIHHLQSILLEHVLKGLKILFEIPGSWTSCLLISMCLAFVLERIEATSLVFLATTGKFNTNQQSTISKLENYYHEVENSVFYRIYRGLSLKLKTGAGRCVRNDMERHICDSFSELRHQLDLEGKTIGVANVVSSRPAQFVLALFDLVKER
ncbi:kinase-like domain-containing protein [Tricladium varicosporioides]|nr:kinase-like domain-containing protein [Hymenoscyphus varicosporioides]